MTGESHALPAVPLNVSIAERGDGLDGSPSPARGAWPVVTFAEARERLARGVLVYRVAEVATMLDARADEYARKAERLTSRYAAVGATTYSDEAQSAQTRAAELRRVADRVRALRDGDVPMARALRDALSNQSAALSKRHDRESSEQARANSEGSAAVTRCLLPSCVTWTEGPRSFVTEAELELLSRVMAGVPDVRVGGAAEQADDGSGIGAEIDAVASTQAYPMRRVTQEEWSELVTAADAARAPWERPQAGVVMFRPDEVAELLEAEARLYLEAAERLLLTRAREGQGAALRYLAGDLRADLHRVRALAPGDIGAARRLVADLQRDCRQHARARRRVLWRPSVDHLPIIVELVEALLLPLEIERHTSEELVGGACEREVYRRWAAGMLDVRDAVREGRRA